LDKDNIDAEFESLLIYNKLDDTPLDIEEEPECMSVVELSAIAQDMHSMLWFIQELMTRVYEEKQVAVNEEVIKVLRKMQEESCVVIEGIDFEDDDEDDGDD
jgi:hypothetical protein